MANDIFKRWCGIRFSQSLLNFRTKRAVSEGLIHLKRWLYANDADFSCKIQAIRERKRCVILWAPSFWEGSHTFMGWRWASLCCPLFHGPCPVSRTSSFIDPCVLDKWVTEEVNLGFLIVPWRKSVKSNVYTEHYFM